MEDFSPTRERVLKMLLAALILVPALLGFVALFVADPRRDVSLLLLGATAHLALTVLLWCGLGRQELGFFLEVDAAGQLFLSITSLLFFVASLYSVPYLLHGTHDEPAALQRFVPCLLWFLAAMSMVSLTQHLALMWAAIEFTTLVSAPLVYFYKRKAALEAAWKYLLLCSVGIALALLGVLFLGIAASAAPGATPGLTLAELTQVAPLMAKPWLKAAFVLALVGYGTKMGLAPMHTWLPDTHSQAPSPVSALLSGSLLNCALLAILRFYQVCLAAGDAAWARQLLLLLGLVSLAVACAFMVGQRDYKRLFAYSSVENMGVVAVGLGLGGGGVYGALLHALNHSLCKAGLFFAAGNILREYGSTQVGEVRGLLRRLPFTGALVMVLMFAIGGSPPFGSFLSEWMIFQAAMNRPSAWIGVVYLLLLTVAFLGMAGVLLPMLQGNDPRPQPAAREARLSVWTPLVMAGAALCLGVYLPPFLSELLRQAAQSLGG